MGIFQNKSVSQKQPSSKLQIIKKRLSEILARFSTKKKNNNKNNKNKTIIIIMKKEEKKNITRDLHRVSPRTKSGSQSTLL